MLPLENKLEKFHSLSVLQYENYLFLGYLTFLNILKEFSQPHIRILMLLPLTLILSLVYKQLLIDAFPIFS